MLRYPELINSCIKFRGFLKISNHITEVRTKFLYIIVMIPLNCNIIKIVIIVIRYKTKLIISFSECFARTGAEKAPT